MKVIILITATFLMTAFGRPATADVLTLFSGYFVETSTARVVGDKIIIDGSGDGNSTLGTFTWTFHAEVDPATGIGKEKAKLTFANGDTWTTIGTGLGDITGVGAIAEVTELHRIKAATGQFAGQGGDLTIKRMIDEATGDSRCSFHGEFLKVE